MKVRVLVLAAAAICITATPALAQSAGAGNSGSSNTSAGGSSASGTSSSSATVHTVGSSVGVVQGNVAGGSTGSGSSSSGSNNANGSVGGQTTAADAPNALTGGALKQLHLPAMDTVRQAVPAASNHASNSVAWALGAAVILGLALVYRRLPKPSRA